MRASSSPDSGWLAWLGRVLKHLWLDADDARRAVPEALAVQWQQGVAQAEGRAGGEIRLCVEAALPLAEVMRIGRKVPLPAVIRQRALQMFAQLGVWDTERNTGVLIYVLVAEHAIEIVADRGLQRVPAAQWQAVADALARAFRTGQQSQGLMDALAQVQALLGTAGLPSDQVNELPDRPHLQ